MCNKKSQFIKNSSPAKKKKTIFSRVFNGAEAKTTIFTEDPEKSYFYEGKVRSHQKR